MNNKQDGGPAFPFSYQTGTDDKCIPNILVSHGMSLRDWFAGMALQGMLANDSDIETYVELADHAYSAADAMLKERSK